VTRFVYDENEFVPAFSDLTDGELNYLATGELGEESE
jgi:hypothetical protein